MKILGVILARKGSSSLPRKNIRPLAGKPLIAYTIEAALNSGCLDRVIVSTDDEEIAGVSRKWGAEVPFLRPSRLARDDTPALEALQHVLRRLKSNEEYAPEAVMTLQPTSPLRDSRHIHQAIRLFRRTGADSVVSVCQAEHSPYWMMRLKRGKVFPFARSRFQNARRQDLPPVYRPNGAVYLTRYRVVTENGRILGSDTRAFVMDAESSLDIDTPLDFKMAGLLLKERNHGRC